MKILRRVLAAFLVLVLLAMAAGAMLLSHDSPCPAASAAVPGGPRMQAVLRRCYGSLAVVHAEQTARPAPGPAEVLVRVHAAAVNPLDWHYVHGTPYLMRADAGLGAPEDPRLGVDFSGTVEAVGDQVTRFHPGDEVFGGRTGAFAQYLVVPENRAIVAKPANVAFAEAAAVPIAALTALQALRDKGQVARGQKVLVNGASGGVGTFAVQLARYFGAEVTAVCSGRSAALVKGLGADHVIDYTREDFTRGTGRYDLIIDTVGSHGLLEYRRVMTPDGRLVIVGGPSSGNWVGPLAAPLRAMLLSPFVSQHFMPFLAELKPQDLQFLASLLEHGELRVVIDRHYALDDLPAALGYLEQGHAHGKVVIDVP
ncbi:MAG TPA: NAD(P)-dependent alcohol dehydrogenase [Steroidobacteraceae bacterium]|nr:NAD(P)-dependent alcohol dehydrogenase [Steroidobacteraceae bacterium]